MFFKGPNFSKLSIPNGLKSKEMKSLIDKEFKVFILKFILSLIALVGGLILICQGIESDSTIKFTFRGLTLELNKVFPGLTLSFISLILMLFSRINIKIK
jgi:hypothetical protein